MNDVFAFKSKYEMNIMNVHKPTFKIVEIEHDYTSLARLIVRIIEKQSIRPCS